MKEIEIAWIKSVQKSFYNQNIYIKTFSFLFLFTSVVCQNKSNGT